jgi:hypothetical protein
VPWLRDDTSQRIFSAVIGHKGQGHSRVRFWVRKPDRIERDCGLIVVPLLSAYVRAGDDGDDGI